MKKLSLFVITLLFSVSVAAQEYAQQQVENSPRHHEWVTINSNDRELHTFVAYPEVDEKVPVVLVIHENRGLNIWARSFADQIAENGYIAVAPDLISNTQDGFVKTSDFATSDDARSALYELDPDKVTTDLMNTLEYAKSIAAGNGNVIVVGFCWGGSQSFRFATNAGDMIEQAIVFYGTGPREMEAYQSIEVPVFGFYGGDDNRVNATIEFSEEAMNEYNKSYEYVIYDGAGHAFMRRGDDPALPSTDSNKMARNQAWEKLNEILSKF
ncbi:MAG: dienelactone hydrolase family protein [Balneolaceae bacterium]|nr:dienelactone hydrolase family protein [Balneolaceae bacterium]